LLSQSRIDAVAYDDNIGANRLGRFSGCGLFKVDGRAAIVLLGAGALAIGQHRLSTESSQHGFVKYDVQAATMDTDFRKGIAGKFSAILAIDQLAETIEERALAIFDAGF